MKLKVQHDEKGFHVMAVALVVLTIGVVSFAGYRVFKGGETKNAQTNTNTQQPADQPTAVENSNVRWESTAEGGWMATGGTPPKCPEPYKLAGISPQLTKATSLLYPGQERQGNFKGQGGNYKPHGGFRFDNSKSDDIDVVSPIDGYVSQGGRFLANGEIQYTFDIIDPCGFMVRIGHVRELSSTFQKYADKFPPAVEGDSRTTRVDGFPAVKAGDLVATSSGFKDSENNVTFDFGVYDLRKTNEASKSAAYQQKTADAKGLAWYALCWLDMLPQKDSSFIKGLPPGDAISGKTSDYCK